MSGPDGRPARDRRSDGTGRAGPHCGPARPVFASTVSPATTELAERIAGLCTRAPSFTDCDLVSEDDFR